jgi:hypothetical protein
MSQWRMIELPGNVSWSAGREEAGNVILSRLLISVRNQPPATQRVYRFNRHDRPVPRHLPHRKYPHGTAPSLSIASTVFTGQLITFALLLD